MVMNLFNKNETLKIKLSGHNIMQKWDKAEE